MDRVAVHVRRVDRRGVWGLISGNRGAAWIYLERRVSADLLAVSEPHGLPVQRDQGHDDGHGDRAGGVLLRLQRQRWACRGGQGDRKVDGAEPHTCERARCPWHADLLGYQRTRPGWWLAQARTRRSATRELHRAQRSITSFVQSRSTSASAASLQPTTRVVTSSGCSAPEAANSSTCGIAGRAFARPVLNVIPFVYISSRGSDGCSPK